jgi:hypothetical protein
MITLRIALSVILAAAACLGVSNAQAPASQQYVLQPPKLNTLNAETSRSLWPLTGAATIPSGGNVGGYAKASDSTPSAQVNGEQIRLVQSAVGFAGPARIGTPGIHLELRRLAEVSIVAATPYKTNTVQGQGTWDIVFPGVIDTATGKESTKARNYFEEHLITADRYFRTAALAVPEDAAAWAGLLRVASERMVPLNFAANSATARATRERLLNFDSKEGANVTGNGTALNGEIAMLRTALQFYQGSAQVFLNFVNVPEYAALMERRPPAVTAVDGQQSILRERQNLLKSFGQSIQRQGETVARLVYLRHMAEFKSQETTINSFEINRDLLAFLDQSRSRFQAQLIVAEAFRAVPAGYPADLVPSFFPSASFAAAQGQLEQLGLLRDAISRGLLYFVGSDAKGRQAFRSYAPEYVPFFFEPQRFQNITTYGGLSAFAQQLAQTSNNLDDQAWKTSIELDQNLANLAEKLNGIFTRHLNELGRLCGYIVVTNENRQTQRVPDLVGALLPPEERASAVDKGEIGGQWNQIRLAQTQLEAAIIDLENTEKRIEKAAQIATTIAGDVANLGQMILNNGDVLAGLEVSRGEVLAQSALYRARLQADFAKEKDLLLSASRFIDKNKGTLFLLGQSGLVAGNEVFKIGSPAVTKSIVGNARSSVRPQDASAGLGVVLSVGNLFNNTKNAYKEAELSHRLGENEAETSRRLAEIAKQQTLLRAQESAAFQFQRQREVLLKNEEQVHSLMLEMERQKLNLLMAEQKVAMEKSALATLLNRVQVTLQEYVSAVDLEGTNPLRSPDFRVIRDAKTMEAEDMFALAQEWAFLASRAALYVATGAQHYRAVSDWGQKILQARSGSRLSYLLLQLDSEIKNVTVDLGTRTQPMTTPISLRDFIFQNNLVRRDGEGGVLANFPALFQSQATGNTATASDGAWLAFLNESYVTDPGSGNPRLRFVFSLNLDQLGQKSGVTNPLERITNPLWSENRFGTFITYLENRPNAFGVRVNIKGRALTGIGQGGETITAELRQEGASYVRQTAHKSDREGKAVQLWNLGVTAGDISASLNGQPQGLANPQFHERSPANDRWVLTIPAGSPANNALLNSRANITDVELIFSLSSFSER